MEKYVVKVKAPPNGTDHRYELHAANADDARGVIERMLARERADGYTIAAVEVAP